MSISQPIQILVFIERRENDSQLMSRYGVYLSARRKTLDLPPLVVLYFAADAVAAIQQTPYDLSRNHL